MVLTVSDAVELARAAVDPAEAVRLLRVASDQGEHCREARQVLRAALEIPGIPDATLRDLLERTLSLADPDGEVAGFEDAAKALATRLLDPAAARAVLERGERSLIATDARGYQWTLLAKSYGAILGDRGAIARCLAAAEEAARRTNDASDMAYAASAWVEMLDREQGIARIAHAESRVCDAYSAWSVANAWHEVGDLPAGRRVLDRTLSTVTSTQEALTIAQACASHHEGEAALRAIGAAEELARRYQDWYEVAETAADLGLGEGLVRRALVQAESHVTSDDERMSLASAYGLWLKDTDAADRLGPRGMRPDDLRPRLRELSGWTGSATSLFDHLRTRIDHPRLRAIADADYGSGLERNLAILHDICTTGLLQRVMPWHPCEVLALTRWSEGDDTDHLARALACTILCLGPADSHAAEIVSNGPILLESCMVLSGPMLGACVEFFVWVVETCPREEDEGCARLMVLLAQAAVDPDDPRLSDLAAQVTALGIEAIVDSMREGLWRELIDRLLAPRPELREMVLRALEVP